MCPAPTPFLSEVIMGNGGCRGQRLSKLRFAAIFAFTRTGKLFTRLDHCFESLILKSAGEGGESLHSQEDQGLW